MDLLNKKNKCSIDINLNCEIQVNQEIDDTNLDGDTVMMDIEKGEYYSINSVGSRIWELAKNKVKISDIVDTLLNEYDIETDKCEESVIKFINKLYKNNLIKIF